jgi:hypothetical protein
MLRFCCVVLALSALPAEAEVLTLSCNGTMNTEEMQHPISKMGLVVNSDARIVTGFTGITARIDAVNANPVAFGSKRAPLGLSLGARLFHGPGDVFAF